MPIKMDRHVTFADDVIGRIPEPPGKRVRKHLKGSELKRKQKQVKRRWLQHLIISGTQEYSDDHFDSDVFEDILTELSLDDVTSSEQIYVDIYDTQVNNPVTVTTDDDETLVMSEDGIPISSLITNSDSGFSEESFSEMVYDVVDETCKELLIYCESYSDRRNAIVVSSLLQEEIGELFVNAGQSISGIGVLSLMKFAHGSGDVHTALNAVLAWMMEEDTVKKSDMSSWCREHGVNAITLKKVMKYVHDLDYLWKNNETSDDVLITSHQYIDDKITTMLTAAYANNLCYYLGHPDLGYRSFLTGLQVPCCPSSPLHLLDKLPDFVLSCGSRHQHVWNSGLCQYMVVLDDSVGFKLATELIPSSIEGYIDFMYDRVSKISGSIRCGVHTGNKLLELWLGSGNKCHPGTSLQQELSTLIDNNHVVLDFIDNKEIAMYAPEKYHDKVVTFIREQLQDIQHNISRKKSVQLFPNLRSGLKFMMSPGGQCEEVYFPGDDVPTIDDDQKSATDMFNISTEVRMNVKIAIGISNDVNCVVAKRLGRILTLIYNKLWYVDNIKTGKASVIAQLVFTTHVAAKRALLLFNDEQDMDVINITDVQLQCRTVQLHINRQVFSAMGEVLVSKLEKLSRSPKTSIQYDIAVDHTEHVVIAITTSMSVDVNNIAQTIQQLFVPLKFVPPAVCDMNIAIHSDACKFILSHIGKHTGTWLHLPSNPEANDIFIYGKQEQKKVALAFLQKFTNKNFNNIWKLEGKPSCILDVFPDDFLLRFHNNTKIYNNSDHDDSFFQVDFDRRMIWSQVPPNMHGAASAFLRENILQLLGNQYGIAVSEDFFDVQVPPTETDTCVACFADTTDFYMLDGCGHVYCNDCLNTQIKTSLRENILPLCCAECNMLFSTIDVRNLIKSYSIPACKWRSIRRAALSGFVANNQELYRFCPRPNCDGLFKKQPKLDGGLICCACGKDVCADCYERVHDGMDCVEYTDFGKWMDENPKNRKKCPKCMMGIEKDGGCNNVTCQHCKMSICWVCLMFEDNCSAIYTHMDSKKHWAP